MINHLLSVIVPVYNACDYLPSLINCILEQSYKNLELILVDDGATDGSDKVCDDFAKKDVRIKVIHKINGGQSSARNEGMFHAKGEFVAFADNDDIIHPDMYKDMISVLESSSADICACKFLNVDNDVIDKIIFEHLSAVAQVMTKQELLSEFFKPTWRIPIWNKVYRASLVKQLSFGNYHLGEDNLFSFQAIDKCNKYVFCNNIYYFQRMHGLNYEFTATEHMIDLLDAKEKILLEIKKNYPECYKESQKLFLYECVRVFNSYSIDSTSVEKRAKILDVIKRNVRGILFSNMPLGHKKLFLKLRCSDINKLSKIISV